MKNQDIIPTIDNLLKDIDGIIHGLNEKGADLFSEGKYEQARALLNKVESITSFRGKILCLKDDWKALNVPLIHKISTTDKTYEILPAQTKPLKKGLKTAYDEFRYPILETLVRLDGAGRVRDVLRIVEEIIAGQLNIYDYLPLSSNPNSVRWKNTAQWERYNMVQDGLLASDSKRGVWEITEAGRDALRKAKDHSDMQRNLFSNK